MNLWVVEPLRKGPIGGNNCHISPRLTTFRHCPAPEGGGALLVVELGGELVVGGVVEVTPLLGGGVVVVSVVGGGVGVVVTEGAGLTSTSAGRVLGAGPGCWRTIPPIVVP